MELELYKVNFDYFETSLKRNGHIGRHRDCTLKIIKKEINFSPERVADRNDIHHFYYRNDFVFDQGNYNTQKILLLAFLMCHHESILKAHDSLWGLINPEINEQVDKEKVVEILHWMCEWSIDVPLKYQLFQMIGDKELTEYLEELSDRKTLAI